MRSRFAVEELPPALGLVADRNLEPLSKPCLGRIFPKKSELEIMSDTPDIGPTKKRTADQPTDRRTGGVIGKLLFQK